MWLRGRLSIAVAVLGSFWIMAGCDRRNESAVPVQSNAAHAATTLVGCVAQTGEPELFLLSVAEPRDAQVDAPPGTALPRDDRTASPAQGANPSGAVATSGEPTRDSSQAAAGVSSGPGAGPTTTTKITTYKLVGPGAKDVTAHVGGTVEVTGSVQEPPSRVAADTQQINGEFQVESVRPLAKECAR